MKGITVRFSDSAYELIKDEAERAGVGITAYVREAALLRAVVTRARREPGRDDSELVRLVREHLTRRD